MMDSSTHIGRRMKALAVALCLVSGAPAAAQQTKITEVNMSRVSLTIVWTNEMTNVFCSLMYTWDLSHGWHAFALDPTWNMHVTNYVMRVGLPLALESHFVRGQNSAFLRFQSSTEPMPPPQTTNLIGFINATASPVTNLYLAFVSNVQGQSIAIPTLSPGATNAWHALVTEDWVSLVTQIPPAPDEGRIYGGYWQTGHWQSVEFQFQYHGPPENKRMMIIGDGGYAVH